MAQVKIRPTIDVAIELEAVRAENVALREGIGLLQAYVTSDKYAPMLSTMNPTDVTLRLRETLESATMAYDAINAELAACQVCGHYARDHDKQRSVDVCYRCNDGAAHHFFTVYEGRYAV